MMTRMTKMKKMRMLTTSEAGKDVDENEELEYIDDDDEEDEKNEDVDRRHNNAVYIRTSFQMKLIETKEAKITFITVRGGTIVSESL